jgi:hypothetical protein
MVCHGNMGYATGIKGGNLAHIQCGAPEIAKLVHNYNDVWVYGSYNYS